MKKIENNKKNEELEEKIIELTNDLQRTRADFENFRKQIYQHHPDAGAHCRRTVYRWHERPQWSLQ